MESEKCPPISAFCESAVRLYTPNLNNLGAKSPIVSGLHLKYSRFSETRARDRARSALRGVGRSFSSTFLWPFGHASRWACPPSPRLREDSGGSQPRNVTRLLT